MLDDKPIETPNLPPFHHYDGHTRLDLISTEAATPSEVSIKNVIHNIKQGYCKINYLSEFRKVKGSDKKIAIVGGGPSIKNYIDDIKQFKTVIACGSANDWMMENGIIPTYATICDPDPVSIKYFQKLDSETKYLVASCCDPLIFEHLKDQQIILWHCDSEEQRPHIEKLEPVYFGIGGGCTVGLRSLSIAIMLGYSNVHMFGFDSCLGDNDKHHAYGFATDEEGLGVIYNVKVGDQHKFNPEKNYRCAGYQLAQAEHFRQFYRVFHHYFTPTIYGDGLIAGMMNNLRQEVEDMMKQEATKETANGL